MNISISNCKHFYAATINKIKIAELRRVVGVGFIGTVRTIKIYQQTLRLDDRFGFIYNPDLASCDEHVIIAKIE